MADALRRGFASDPAQEALGPTVACGARVLSFARVFVLSGGVAVRAAVMADLDVGRTGADCDFVSETMASGALYEGLRIDGDLHGNALVVHVSWFGKELTERRASGVMDHDVDGAGRRLRVGGRIRCPSWAIIEGEPCGGSSVGEFLEKFVAALGEARGVASDRYVEEGYFLYGAAAGMKDVLVIELL